MPSPSPIVIRIAGRAYSVQGRNVYGEPGTMLNVLRRLAQKSEQDIMYGAKPDPDLALAQYLVKWFNGELVKPVRVLPPTPEPPPGVVVG